MSNELPFFEKRALVTGGSRGIGNAIVKQLVKSGYEVFYFSRTEGELIPHSHHIEVDMGSVESVDIGLKQFFSINKRIDVVVNNAGITRDNLIMRASVESW